MLQDPNLPRHPIGVVAARTGLSPDVLRVWERRYGAVRPGRAAGGRGGGAGRLYSDADIERLSLLARATAQGRSIGQVVRLEDEALRELVRGDQAARRVALRDAPGESPDEASALVAASLEAVRSLDGLALERVLRRAQAALGVPALLEGVLGPVLRRTGDEWAMGELSPAAEHVASVVARRVLADVLESLRPSPGAPVVVVSTPAGERHELGALMAAVAAALIGWRVLYLGPDLPASEIGATAVSAAAAAVALSLVRAEDGGAAAAELARVRAAVPADVPVIVGGAAAQELSSRLEAAGLVPAESLRELKALLGDAAPRRRS